MLRAMVSLPSAVRRLGWGLADQALTSLSNFTLGVIVARTVGPTGFGAFSLAFAAYLTTSSISRALVAQPMLVRYSGSSLLVWRKGTSSATGTALVLGVVAGLVCVIAAWLTDDTLSNVLLAVGVMMPGLLLLDVWRYAFFAAARGMSAFVMDAVFVALLFASLGSLIVSGGASALWPTLAWGSSATVVALATCLWTGVVPRPLRIRMWWSEHRDIALRYVGEAITDAVGIMLSFNAIAFFAGLAAVGALRAANLALGPVNILLQGTSLVAIAEGVRLLKRSGRRLRNGCVLLSGALVAATVAWGAISLAIPDGLGLALLGSTWDPARSVLLPAVVATAGTSASVGAWVGLRALGAAKQSLRARVIHSVLTVACAPLGAVLAGTQGAAWALAATAWFGAVLWSAQFAWSLSERRNSSASEAMSSPAIGGW